MNASNLLIDVAKVSVRHNQHAVLDKVDLQVHRGEIVTLIGPNGCGKTTLVRIALGLIAPDSGQVQRADKIRIGYVPQRLHIDETMPLTVERFLDLGACGQTHRFENALAQAGAGHVLKSPVQSLSGGELRRVLLTRALLQDPELLVLDEPSAGVDVVGQSELYDLFKSLRDEMGCGVLLVSHDLHLVMAATDRVICLNHHVCCEGRPDAVSQHPEYLTLFGSRLQDRLAVYTHHHDHTHDLAGNIDHSPDERHAHNG